MDRLKTSLTFLIIVLTLAYGRRVQSPCVTEKLLCDDGDCIERSFWCDDIDDCFDKSDEKYCSKTSPNNCTDKHFICGTGICVPISVRCDGVDDCKDNSDERNCDVDVRDPHRQKNPGATTAAPEISTSAIQQSGADESGYNNRHYNPHSHLPVYPTAPPPAYYNAQNQPHNRNSDTRPEGNFPRHPYATEETPQRRDHRTNSRPDVSHIELENPMLFAPRVNAINPPRIKSPTYPRRKIRPPSYSHFYFAKNYTENFQYTYQTNIEKAKGWLLSTRNESYNWGSDTSRALIALSLISNSFKSDEKDNELMKKGFQTYLGIKLLRNSTDLEKIGTNRLAMYINALLATCHDPKDFLGLDLVGSLQHAQYHLQQRMFVNPNVFLTLCLTNVDFDVEYLKIFIVDSFTSEVRKDFHILATTAMACLLQRNPRDNDRVARLLDQATRNLITQMNPDDGSFGSKYSTALAAQALMSINSTYWNPRKTLDFLAKQQQADGSFGDMLSTYYTLIALSGRSLLHLRNTLCEPLDDEKVWTPEDILNQEGPKKSILYSLIYGLPRQFSADILLTVPVNTNFYDIMRVAAYQDPRFKYSYKVFNGQISIQRIANVPNDPELGMFWTLYWKSSTSQTIDLKHRYTDDIKSLNPQHGDQVVFWYLSDWDL